MQASTIRMSTTTAAMAVLSRISLRRPTLPGTFRRPRADHGGTPAAPGSPMPPAERSAGTSGYRSPDQTFAHRSPSDRGRRLMRSLVSVLGRVAAPNARLEGTAKARPRARNARATPDGEAEARPIRRPALLHPDLGENDLELVTDRRSCRDALGNEIELLRREHRRPKGTGPSARDRGPPIPSHWRPSGQSPP